MAWRFNAVDKAGPFAWSSLEEPNQYKAVIEKLSEFETMNEKALGASGCHFIEVAKLCKEAKTRLIDLDLDDLDEIFSMRINGKVRVHGVHRPHYMRVLWYDPEHQVCPSTKKNT